MEADDNEQWLKRSAFHYLGQRSSSTENLRRILTKRVRRRLDEEDFEGIHEVIERVVAFCVNNGLVNDGAYAEMKVASGARSGVSRRKLSAKLASKGISRDIISNAVSEVDDEASAILFAKRRKLGPWKTEQSTRDVQKDIAALARAGFPVSVAIKIANLNLEEFRDNSG